jgi:hypothetical protein
MRRLSAGFPHTLHRRYGPAAAAVVLGLAILAAAAAPASASNPVGSYDLASAQPGLVRVAGWSLDSDSPTTSLQMHVYVGGPAGTAGVEGHPFTAAASRSDVAAAYPGAGPNHGLDVTFETAKRGVQQVCMHAINVGPGSNVLLGCKSVSIGDPNPVGSFDLASSQPGLVRVAGWSLDPNSPTTSLAMHVYVGGEAAAAGAEGHPFTAALSRPDVAAAYPGAGDAHGLDVTFESALRGSQPVCVYAINLSAGGNLLLGCKTVTIADPNPLGGLDSASSQPGTLRVTGWSFDPNAPTDPERGARCHRIGLEAGRGGHLPRRRRPSRSGHDVRDRAPGPAVRLSVRRQRRAGRQRIAGVPDRQHRRPGSDRRFRRRAIARHRHA